MNLRMAASPWNEPDGAGRWARYSSHEAGGQASECEPLNVLGRVPPASVMSPAVASERLYFSRPMTEWALLRSTLYQTDDGIGIGSLGTSVATETCGHVRGAKFKKTVCEYWIWVM